MNSKSFYLSLCLTGAVLFSYSAGANAQDNIEAPGALVVETETPETAVEQVSAPEAQPQSNEPVLMPMMEKAQLQRADIQPESIRTLLFLKDEYELLQKAKQTLVTRAPTMSEIERADQFTLDGEPGDPGLRELSLAGIVYRSGRDWTIWFNEQRVTPGAIPSEVLDIKVYKDYIEVKWFDEYTNQIFPIRLRPHQRFNLDSRLYLPG